MALTATITVVTGKRRSWWVEAADLILEVGGMGLIVTGAALVYPPAGFVFAGAAMILVSWRLNR